MKGLRTFICALWIGIAHIIGAIARGIGRSARDLDPAHRRDGLGLLYLCAAITIASVVWFDVSGFVSGVITSLVTGAFGIFDTVAPLALLGVAIQILRHPDAPSQKKGRLTIGWTLLALSAMGTTHIVLGNPQPVQGAQAMRDAAGWVGWCVSASLNSAVGIAVTVLILVIVTFLQS
jgi:S-DNA-T family DNA segregation ATPase FtsK/SpoIIIE